MNRSLPLFVAGLLFLAGCTGTPGSGPTATGPTASPTAMTTPSATPTSTEETTPTIPNGPLAPGVTDEGIVNLTALLEAHGDALLANGFEVALEREVRVDGETRAIERRTVATAHLRRLRGNATSTLGGNRSVYRSWVNATMGRLLSRVESGGEIQYRIPRVGTPGEGLRARYLPRFAGTARIQRLLEGLDFAVRDVNQSDGERLYTLVARNDSTHGGFAEREVYLYLRPGGTIEVLKATGELADGGSFAFGYHLRRLGVETVERPDWVADAPAPVDSRPTLGFENCTKPYLVLENPGPDALPAGTVVSVTLNGTTYRAGLDESVPAGERRALYLDASGVLRTAGPESVPATRRGMPKDASFTVSTGEGMLLTSGGIGFGCERATPAEPGGSTGSGGSGSAEGG